MTQRPHLQLCRGISSAAPALALLTTGVTGEQFLLHPMTPLAGMRLPCLCNPSHKQDRNNSQSNTNYYNKYRLEHNAPAAV
jgi:hypothetical protein